ncbi:DUF222 domain-containing protein [Isoptericola sp. NPDC019482]|uniref:HNH endonuclease signature motif containing protein n=1 Tax=Isoptericola sp. NPDC019482 TaxID=3154688 RepID=UPI00348F746B
MTTTLPDPVNGTDAGAPGYVGDRAGSSVDLRAEADRLAAMPRNPSIGELLEEESRRHQPSGRHAAGGDDTGGHDVERPQASTDRQPLAGRPTLADLDRVLDQLAANDTDIATLHAERAVLLALAAGLAEALETDLLDQDDPTARRAPSARRLELAHRAVTAEIATALRIGEHAAGTLTDHAVTLTDKAPGTLRALHDGHLSWAHATAISTHVADLSPEESASVEQAVLATILDRDTGRVTCTPTQTGRRARRARETAHPTPADVRHTEATQRRAVWLDDGRDGMAWITAHLPAPLAHAAYDRLTRTAHHLTSSNGSAGGSHSGSGEHRTFAQARADALAALLLDDGTLDVAAVPGPGPRHTRQDTRRHPDQHGGQPDGQHEAPPEGQRADSADLEHTETGDDLDRLLHQHSALAALARSIRPQVTVTIPVLTLLGLTDAPAVLDGRVPIDPDTARQLTALAPSLRRILTHPETGTVLSVGRTTYAVPADLKALVRARDTTCRFPGCTHPAAHADLDHTTAWAHGGTTSATNLAALCRRHHVTKHRTRWQVTQRETSNWGGTLEWTSPTGRRYVTAPEPVDTTRHRHPPHGPDIPETPETPENGPPNVRPDGPPDAMPNGPPF